MVGCSMNVNEPNENERDSGSQVARPNHPQELPVESAQVAPSAWRHVARAALAAEPVKPQEPAAAVRPLLALLARWLSFHTESAGLSLETVEDTELLSAFFKAIEAKRDALAAETYAALAVKPQEPAPMSFTQHQQAWRDEVRQWLSTSKVQIRYELGDRFWHDNCAAASGPGRSMMKPERHGETHSLIRCLSCGVAGWYPVGRVGDVECDPEAVKPQEKQGEPTEDRFCDANCTWLDHHPQCVRAESAATQADPVPGMVLTEQQILDAATEAGLWPNTVQSWIPAFHRYHAALNRMLSAAPKAVKPSPAQGEPL